MRRRIQFFLATGIVALLIGGPLWYRSHQRRELRNFRIVRPGVLYRSGQLSRTGLQRVIREHGIRTVVTLRDADVPGQMPPDWEEEAFCRKEEIYHYRLRPRCWWSPDGPAPAWENVDSFLQIVDDPKHHPILIHCFAGAHRTGAYCAIFRMEFDRWDNDEAVAEVHAAGYQHLYAEEDVLEFLQKYEPRWKSGQ